MMRIPVEKIVASLAVIFLVGGCANTPSNKSFSGAPNLIYEYDFKSWIKAQEKMSEDLIVMSFSGGGLRATTLAASVLDQLKDQGLANKIALISSTSGGSVAAGYFAAKGVEGMTEFRNQFLYNDNTSDLTHLLLPSFLSGSNRSQQFAGYLDERLFQRKSPTYQDLIRRWNKDRAPFVVLNASDMSSGWTFEFTQESFSYLCSDLTEFRISEAMAASAAFPFLMTPIPLRNHWDKPNCSDKMSLDKEYKEVFGNRYTNLAKFVKARYYREIVKCCVWQLNQAATL